MNKIDFFTKRSFDFVASLSGLILLSPVMALSWIFASVEVKGNGFFTQNRVGMQGKLFRVVKIKTMRPVKGFDTSVTSSLDPRITKLGALFRRTKIDELPQLWNVFVGDMSLVGPRPDVPGYADLLEGNDRIILTIRPGITGPASLAFKEEEQLLATQADPEKYNKDVIYPQKVSINIKYIEDWSLWGDIKYILKTII